MSIDEGEPNNGFPSSDLPLSYEEPDVDVRGFSSVGDPDIFSVFLHKGDIFGIAVNGPTLDSRVRIYDPNFMQMTEFDIGVVTLIHPAASTLPRIAHPQETREAAGSLVAPTTGRYYLQVNSTSPAPAEYTMSVAVRRNIFESLPGRHQILFIDFDGEVIDGSIFATGNNPANLSPLSAFLHRWELGPSDESAVIDAILAQVDRNFSMPLAENPAFRLEVRNSRDHADPWGDPDVSRIIVGGTIAELGVTAHGIAQSIDPGNFEAAETGVVMLDTLSGSASVPTAVNALPRAPGVTIIEAIGVVIGNIVSHEAGHIFGNWHTDPHNTQPAIMDAGVSAGNVNFRENHYDTGPDGILGTEDDVLSLFVTDVFGESVVAEEGSIEFTGVRTAFGLSSVPCPADVFIDGVVDGADLAALLALWGAGGVTADINGDGVVDGADVAALLAAWGECESME